jgi:hypothetical protein
VRGRLVDPSGIGQEHGSSGRAVAGEMHESDVGGRATFARGEAEPEAVGRDDGNRSARPGRRARSVWRVPTGPGGSAFVRSYEQVAAAQAVNSVAHAAETHAWHGADMGSPAQSVAQEPLAAVMAHVMRAS